MTRRYLVFSLSGALLVLFALAGSWGCAGGVGEDGRWEIDEDAGDLGGDAGEEGDGGGEGRDGGEGADGGEEPAPEPGVPGNVTATAGDLPDAVVITWAAVEDAAGYEVARDGATTFAVAGGELSYRDETAGGPGPLEAPTNVTASSDRGDGVQVAWQYAPASPGTTHSYAVRALFADGPGELSGAVEGFRGAHPTRFEVRRGSGEWNDVVTATSYLDEAAPFGTLLSPGQTRATKGAHLDRVYLQIRDLEITDGPQSAYEVRAIDDHHAPAVSAPVQGRRAGGVPPLQWERSPGGTASGFVALTGATSAPFSDLSAPADGTPRHWRARLTLPGESPQYSEPDMGYRAVDCIVDETFDGQVSFVNQEAGLSIPLSATPPAENANLQALWEATLPAPNWEAPQVLAPPISVNQATVVATSFRVNQQFWLQDSQRAFQVYLEDALSVDVRVGQKVSFTATAIDVFNGNPQVSSLQNFVIHSEENPVYFRDLRTEDVSLADDYLGLVRLGGKLTGAQSCSGAYFCYDFTYGPANNPRTVALRSSSQFAENDACVTYFGPVIAFPGPFSTLPQAPAVQLQTDSFQWTRW